MIALQLLVGGAMFVFAYIWFGAWAMVGLAVILGALVAVGVARDLDRELKARRTLRIRWRRWHG